MNLKKITFLLMAGMFLSAERNANAQTATYNYTGSPQTWTTPCGVTSVTVDMAGAQGGSGGGMGGRVQCTYATVGGTVFNIYVGGQGAAYVSSAPGGYNGGGNAGVCTTMYPGAGGGGATDIRVGGVALANRVIVAGGGGGVQQINGPSDGGAGGGLTGGNATSDGNGCLATYATGGSQVAGGIDATSSGACCTFTPTANGSLGVGADGAGPSVSCNGGDGGAGGGGGYYGGGGGGGYSSGGGGSSYTNGSCSGVIHTQGFQTGNGYLTLTWTVPTPLSAVSGVVVNNACFGVNNGKASETIVTGNSPPYTYVWTPSAQTNATATGLSAGTYTVQVKDDCGNIATASVTITQAASALTDGAPTLNFNALCFGGNGSATAATAAGGTSPYTYAWNGGTTSTSVTNSSLTAGTYTVDVTDANGCTCTSSSTVTITQPATAVTVSTGSIVNDVCGGGNTGSAKATAAGGTGTFTYSWAPSGGNAATATGLTAGTYTITVNDANGCAATATATITEPPVLTVSTGSIVNIPCNGGNSGSATATASGGTGAYTYAWSPGGAINATATGLVANIYTVTVNDANGCAATATATITQPNILTVTTGSIVNILCNGDNNGSITATPSGGTGPYTYAWAPGGAANATATGLVANMYTVTVTDANGCTATASGTITQPNILTVATTPTNVSCNGAVNGSITATPSGGTSAYTYSWAPGGQTNASATGLAAGTYTVTVTDANGCTTTATATITQPTALSITKGIIPAWVNHCNGKAYVTVSGGTAPYTYKWSPGGATTDTLKNACDSMYCCTVTDKNGCVDSVCMSVATGISAISNASSIKIFPNPNNGMFTISGLSKGMEIEVYNYLGEKISDMKATNANMQFNLADKSPGAYLVRILSQDGQLVGQEKVLKQD